MAPPQRPLASDRSGRVSPVAATAGSDSRGTVYIGSSARWHETQHGSHTVGQSAGRTSGSAPTRAASHRPDTIADTQRRRHAHAGGGSLAKSRNTCNDCSIHPRTLATGSFGRAPRPHPPPPMSFAAGNAVSPYPHRPPRLARHMVDVVRHAAHHDDPAPHRRGTVAEASQLGLRISASSHPMLRML